jgi:ankyrin repeat protein
VSVSQKGKEATMRTLLFPMAVGLALVPAALRGGEIHDAATAGDVAKVKQLLAANPELVNAKDDIVRTPLHWAAARGHNEIVSVLLDHRAQVDEEDAANSTPLYVAVQRGYLRTAGLLLSRGANVNCRQLFGRTALHRAAEEGNLRMVELLLCYGANVNAESRFGTPLKQAIEGNHTAVADMLRRAGARE